MTTPTPPRRVGKPRKVVSDEARAEELLEELRQAEMTLRETTTLRMQLALQAHDIGLTTTKIGEAVGVSQTAVSKWVRAAREMG